MSIQCESCGDYMFQGTKCNCRKELCYSEFYLGINVHRIYLHCKSCYAEITMKTDPKNCDYVVEKGATRHFEPWRDYQVQQALEMKRQCAGNPLEQAEERTIDTQRDMDQERDLGRLCAVSCIQDKFNPDAIRPAGPSKELLLTEEDKRRIELFDQEKKQKPPQEPVGLRTMPRVGSVWTSKSGWADEEESE
jgi:hypothetical protein